MWSGETMSNDLSEKVLQALQKTGYPLELEIATIARTYNWVPFHAREYPDPDTGKLRELDMLLYKQIHSRRIEIRVSCKSSLDKQFVFFEIDRRRYAPMGEAKCTPVVSDSNWGRNVRDALLALPIFSYPFGAINYTVLSGSVPDREARTLLRDAIMSSVTSLHYRILPGGLLHDRRGTVYFFLVVIRGRMYSARFNEELRKMDVVETDYAVWEGRIPIPDRYSGLDIPNATGGKVPFSDAFYWFGPHIHVEIVSDTAFAKHLVSIETAFQRLTPEQLGLFGKPWNRRNFPRTVEPPPHFDSE
jgi:hypothetical protein